MLWADALFSADDRKGRGHQAMVVTRVSVSLLPFCNNSFTSFVVVKIQMYSIIACMGINYKFVILLT